MVHELKYHVRMCCKCLAMFITVVLVYRLRKTQLHAISKLYSTPKKSK